MKLIDSTDRIHIYLNANERNPLAANCSLACFCAIYGIAYFLRQQQNYNNYFQNHVSCGLYLCSYLGDCLTRRKHCTVYRVYLVSKAKLSWVVVIYEGMYCGSDNGSDILHKCAVVQQKLNYVVTTTTAIAGSTHNSLRKNEDKTTIANFMVYIFERYRVECHVRKSHVFVINFYL